jgi:hypothetical protein
LPAYIAHWRTSLRQSQGVGNLLFGELARLHRLCSWAAAQPGHKRPYSGFHLKRNFGPTSPAAPRLRRHLAAAIPEYGITEHYELRGAGVCGECSPIETSSKSARNRASNAIGPQSQARQFDQFTHQIKPPRFFQGGLSSITSPHHLATGILFIEAR